MNHYISTKAIVINKKTVKDNDILVTLITPTLGKVTALAKGVRSIKSHRLSSLQLGNVIKINLYSKNDFLWISESQTIKHFSQSPKNLTQSNLLFYFLEVINHLVAENQHLETVFPTMEKVIDAINHNQFNSCIMAEINLIKELGFGLPIEIIDTFNQKDYRSCQTLIKRYFETIIEKPLVSSKLFF